MSRLPPIGSQRELRALVALIFSVLGSAVLTAMIAWLVWILWRGGWAGGTELARIEKIGLLAILLVVVMGISFAGLQLAINRRVLKGSAFGASFEASGGDDNAPEERTLKAASEALAEKADEIAADGEDAKP